MLGKARRWVVERFGVRPILTHVVRRRVPRSPWYFGDGATLLFLLFVQVVTGAMMALTYTPSFDDAYRSVQTITFEQTLGWFVRGLHYWSAGLMVVVLVWHLLRQILLGGYKSPREGTWLIGVALFVLVIAMSYTGYLLRWDERGLYGLRVGLNVLYLVPWIGEELVLIAQGGAAIGTQTLTRLYALHAIIVPLLILPLAGWHLYLIVLHGTTSVTERRERIGSAEEQRRVYEEDAESEERGEWFFPSTAGQSLMFAAVVFALAVMLTLMFGPRQLDAEANLTAPSFPGEEWWFAWASGLAALLPAAVAPVVYVALPIAVVMGLVLLPFVDRQPTRGIRQRPVAVAFVVLVVLALAFLSDYRRRSPFTGWPSSEPPSLPANVELTESAAAGWRLFAVYGCNSCHSVASGDRHVGPDLARIRDRYSRDELRNYILVPPEDVAMPSYAGRISDEELERIVEFVLVSQMFPRAE